VVDAAVYKTDERASRLILPHLKPDYMVVTNLSRDTLKRNAHTDYIFSVINTYCPETTRLVLNADCTCSSQLRPGNNRVFFGIGAQPGDHTEPYNLIADNVLCPKCGSKLLVEKLSIYANYGKRGITSYTYKLPNGMSFNSKGTITLPLCKGISYTSKTNK
jgi:hypothetical protein